MEVSFSKVTLAFNFSNNFSRPKEHHVFHVLHWIKAAFKKHALDGIKEADCLNKEAFRSVYLHVLCDKDMIHFLRQAVCIPFFYLPRSPSC